MNDMSLSRLYRRLVSERPQASVDAAHAKLASMLRELKPESEALASKVGERRVVAHPTRQRDLRAAGGARRLPLRWASSIAASLAVVFGLWSWHGREAQQVNAVSASTSAKGDRIFTSQDRIFASSADSHARSDELFRGDLSRGG